jgi:signal transduction histidine kinase
MSLSSTLINEIPTQVLIVDDSAADRNLVRLSLQEATKFYSLDCAERLSEGLEKLSNSQPHVILLDLNLPDSQGNEGVQKVLHKAPDVPILVLTGADDDRMAVEAVRHGAQDYIVKGQMDSHELTRAMEHAIERHQVLATLRESRRKQLDFKDKFLSHVSHELRSPLACIHQFVEVMLDGLAGPLTDKEREYLEGVLRNAGQLNSLISDLLDAASANVGKLTIEPARVDVTEVIEQIVLMLTPKAKARGVELTTTVGGALPAVRADRRRLVQIFINLVENALKFTDAGGRIRLSAGICKDDSTLVQFSVADTGQGINPHNLELIFDRLYQEHNAVFNRHGLGLGLAICKDLVEQHGGRIWAESKLGEGSVFSFTLPLFSLPAIVSKILVHEGKVQEASVIAIEIARGSQTVTDEAWELARRRCRAIVESCVLPDKDLLLPLMHPRKDRDIIFVLVCADASGTTVLERRILGQLTAAPQIADSSVYRTFCIPLPKVDPADKRELSEQLSWISEKMEKAILQAGGL